MTRQRGFTLIEAIMVMVVIGLASAVVARLQGGLFANQSSMQTLQAGTSQMQACAEQMLAVRRWTLDGYNAVTSATFGTTTCGIPSGASGFTVTLAAYAGTACPSGAACKTATISRGGLTPLTVMLVDY